MDVWLSMSSEIQSNRLDVESSPIMEETPDSSGLRINKSMSTIGCEDVQRSLIVASNLTFSGIYRPH